MQITQFRVTWREKYARWNPAFYSTICDTAQAAGRAFDAAHRQGFIVRVEKRTAEVSDWEPYHDDTKKES